MPSPKNHLNEAGQNSLCGTAPLTTSEPTPIRVVAAAADIETKR